MVFLRALVKSPLRTTKLSILPMPSSTTRPAGLYAIEIFYRSFPAIPDHTFEDLVEILTLHHAPTFIPTTNSTLGYSNAMSTTASALAAPIDAAAGHAQIIAKHQKELVALNKKNGVVQPDISIVMSMVTRKVALVQTAMSSRPTRSGSTLRSTSLPRTI